VDKGIINNWVDNTLLDYGRLNTNTKPAISYLLPNNRNSWLYYNPIASNWIGEKVKERAKGLAQAG
jgi:hypothetical protein